MDEKQMNQLEIAGIFGQPLDPRKPVTDLVASVCDVAAAEPNEYHYYYDAHLATNKTIITNTASGIITMENITPYAPAALTFVDVATPGYYIYLKDLASAKEETIARKKADINRALNYEENYRVLTMLEAAAESAGTSFYKDSSVGRFTFKNLVEMMDSVIDYGDNFSLIVSAVIDKDIKLFDWNDNKYQSLKVALENLNVEIVRVGPAQTVTRDSSATPVIPTDKAYLVAKDSSAGKPVLFVRKKLNFIDGLPGVIVDTPAERPERKVIILPNPVIVSTNNLLAWSCTGYEQIVLAVKNYFACASFTRS